MIQITHLKLQQVLARVVPDGVYVDVDGLAEVDLGNGTNYNPAEALNMYFQTGTIVGRSLTQDGELNNLIEVKCLFKNYRALQAYLKYRQ